MKNTSSIQIVFLLLSFLAAPCRSGTEGDRNWRHPSCRKQLSLPLWASFLGLNEATLGKKVQELRRLGITRIPLLEKHGQTTWLRTTLLATQRRTQGLQKMLPDAYLSELRRGTGRSKLAMADLFSIFLQGDSPHPSDPTPAWLALGAAVGELLELTFEPSFAVSELNVRLERETNSIPAIRGFHLDGSDVTATVSFGAPGTEFLDPVPRVQSGLNAGEIDWPAVREVATSTEQIPEGMLVVFTNNGALGTKSWMHRPPEFRGVRRRLWLARYNGNKVAEATSGPSSSGTVSPLTQMENKSR